MSAIAAAYSSSATWLTSQAGNTATDAGAKDGTASTSIETSSSAPGASVTTVSISYRAKLMLARAAAERSVVDQLRAQLDALRTDRPAAALGGSDANDALSAGMDLFKIIGGAGNDIIKTHANATIDAGAGNDVIDTYGHANVVAGDGDDIVSTYGHSTVDGGAGNDRISTYGHSTVTAVTAMTASAPMAIPAFRAATETTGSKLTAIPPSMAAPATTFSAPVPIQG